MMGIELPFVVAPLRKKLLFENKVFTGSAKDPNVLRLLPPLNIDEALALNFIARLRTGITEFTKTNTTTQHA